MATGEVNGEERIHMDEFTPAQMKQIKECMLNAAETGARKALADLGLDDEHAVHDLNDLRSLLSNWKEVRREALKTMTRIVTTVLLGAIAFGAWFWVSSGAPPSN